MNEIYKAIYDQLTANLTTSVFGHVPQDTKDYPFCVVKPLQTNNSDTDSENGFTATIEIITYSRYRGTKEVSDIADNVYNSLHRWAFPDTTNYGVSSITESFRRVATQSDGLTRNAVQQYQIFFEPLPV